MKTLDILQEHLNNHSPFHIKWNCPYCSKLYNKDVLQKIVSIKDQCIMNGQPSVITLLGDNGQPLIVIEITIRRKLTKKILEFYESNHIILIHYQLHENDWMNITQKLSQPNHVTFCGNPECYNFQFYQNCIQREIFLQKFKCKKCNKIVDGYMVRNTSAFGVIGLDNLTILEKNQIISTYFRGKRATTADIVVYGKCRCTPHSKGLVCLTKSELIKETQKGKITKKDMNIARKAIPYIRVLGFNKHGKKIISAIASNNPKLKIIISLKRFLDSNPDNSTKQLLSKDILATNIYTLGLKENPVANLDYTHKIIEIK